MNSIAVSQTPHSIVFSRKGTFLTSIPLRRRIEKIGPDGNRTWTALNLKPGERADLVRRLTTAVNSDGPGSLFQKIHTEVNQPYVPSLAISKGFETRRKNQKARRRQGRGRVLVGERKDVSKRVSGGPLAVGPAANSEKAGLYPSGVAAQVLKRENREVVNSMSSAATESTGWSRWQADGGDTVGILSVPLSLLS